MGKAKSDGGNSQKRNTTSHVQVLGWGTDTLSGALPSMQLFFDSTRLLFNCGEGLQRLSTDSHVKLVRIDHILLTRLTTDATAGLVGMLLTISELGTAEFPIRLTIHGPPGVQHLQGVFNRVIGQKRDLHVTFNPMGFDGEFHMPEELSKEACDVVPMLLYMEEDDDEGGEEAEEGADATESAVLPEPTAADGVETAEGSEPPPAKRARTDDAGDDGPPPPPEDDEPEHDWSASVCYLCKLTPTTGKFDLAKAQQLGVPRGPMYGMLQRGESVTLPDGKVVEQRDVCAASTPGPRFLLVDCPTVSHLPSLLAQDALQPYMKKGDGDAPCAEGEGESNEIACVMHLSPAEVVADPRYTEWMQSLNGSPQHVMSNSAACAHQFNNLPGSATLRAKTNYVHPAIFPLPPPLPPPSDEYAAATERMAAAGLRVAAGVNRLKFTLKPTDRLSLDDSDVAPPVVVEHVQRELVEAFPAIVAEVDKLRALGTPAPEVHLGTKGLLTDTPHDVAEVVFLGTGSAIPSKYRNVSAIYLDVFKRGGLLMDCGEGTLGQLNLRYSREQMLQLFTNVKCLWISHMHADHHAGTAAFLAARRRALGGDECQPLLVVGPRGLSVILKMWERLQGPLGFSMVDARETATGGMKARAGRFVGDAAAMGSGAVDSALSALRDEDPLATAALAELRGSLGLEVFRSVDVIHCRNAYGLVVKSTSGWKLVYSGDTRPCPKLVEEARDATVLIHEATFDDDMEAEAMSKRHSMTKEAVQTGVDARVYRTILTHFSQRYPKIPVWDHSFSARTGVAFDLMAVNFGHLEVLPALIQPLKHVFTDETFNGEPATEPSSVLGEAEVRRPWER